MTNKIKLDESVEEFKTIHAEWKKQAKEQTLETLPAFLDHLLNDYEHDYGTVVHAVACGAVATCWAMNTHEEYGGITGFQASYVMWGFVRQWMGKEGYMRLVDYDEMLYPQNVEMFDRTMSSGAFKRLQSLAQQAIRDHENGTATAADEVVAHWKTIMAGFAPFGWRVGE